jgi:hypothetical protein
MVMMCGLVIVRWWMRIDIGAAVYTHGCGHGTAACSYLKFGHDKSQSVIFEPPRMSGVNAFASTSDRSFASTSDSDANDVGRAAQS